jgi:PAS domain S-box-containing protein
MFRYGFAIVSVLIAVGLALLLRAFGLEKFFLLMPAIVAAWYGGIGPAVLAHVLSTLALAYFFIPPLHSVAVTADQVPYVVAFALFGLVTSWLAVSLRRAERSLVRARDELHAKVQERTAELQRSNDQLRDEIAERERTEEEATRQAALLRLAHDAILVRDLESRIVFWNPGAMETYGWTADEAVGRVTHELLQTRFPISLEAVDAALRERGEWEGELTHITRAGTPIVVASRWSLQRDERGAPTTILEINRDVTERKRAEEEVRKQAALLTLAHDAILVRDLENRVVFWNPGAVETYGWTAEEAIGRVTHELLQTKFPVSLEAVDAALQQQGRWGGELTHRTRAGGSIVVASRQSLQRDERGAPTAILEINRDITDRKRAEEALRTAEAKLAHVTRVTTLGEVTASLAHEVNQPLAAIVNNANACLALLLAGRPDLDEIRTALADITSDADRASKVIERVRALAKRSPPEKVPIRLGDVVEDVVALTATESAARRVTIRTEVAADLPVVSGDRVQLQQVLLNLVVNGMDAMGTVHEQGRLLEIRGRQDLQDGSPAATISVQDQGIGLDAAQMGRLFESFYTTKPHGMGMGLAISRSIIEMHSGRLWAEPNQGPGATFSFSVPAAVSIGAES